MYTNSLASRIKNILVLGFFCMVGVASSYAELTDIADKPIAGTATVDVKPNIMLLMDTSGSMGFGHMPDPIEGDAAIPPIGYKSYQCNSIYYNPNTTYGLPKGADGVSLPLPSFTSALYNYYSTNTTRVDLGTDFQAYDNATRSNQSTAANDVRQAAYYYIYTGAEALSYRTLPCIQPDVWDPLVAVSSFATAGGGQWTRKIVSATSGVLPHIDERQNFAIWYVYYRTRMAMTKSSVGLAFAPITSRFRVGFVSANPGLPVAADSYLAIADFTTTNKAAWYAKINAQVPVGSSPMREGLARVGRHYANKHDGINNGMVGDPVQYSCQRNFTLMTTDGYWNAAAETAGPVKLDGSTLVGNQDGSYTGDDGSTPYGVWDGGSTTTRVTTNKSSVYSYASCDSGYVLKTLQQKQSDTTWVGQSTTQQKMTTDQNLQSTRQYLKSTLVNLQSTSQTNQLVQQTNQKIVQNRMNTFQNNQTQVQTFQATQQSVKTETQNYKTTTNFVKTVSNTYKSTSQGTKTTSQINVLTQQVTKTTTQYLKSTSQFFTTTSAVTQTLSSPRLKNTVQKVLQYINTSQLNSYNGLTELSTPTGSCIPSGSITCYTVTTPNTLVASCTAASPSAANNYTQTNCPTTAVSSCSGTGCNTISIGPTIDATCTEATASSSNGYTTTTCIAAVPSTTTNVAACVAASPTVANLFTTIACPAIAAPVTAASQYACVASGPTSANNYVTTTCPPAVTTSSVPIQNVCVPVTGTAANQWVTTTCPAASVVGPTVGVACSNAAGTSPNWITTSCGLTAAITTPALSCTVSAASALNSWTVTSCPAATVVGPTIGVACTADPASSANSYVATTCGNTSAVLTAIQPGTCVASGPTSANAYKTTTCPVEVPVTSGLNAACVAVTATSSNGWTTTTCPIVIPVETQIATTCATQNANSGNGWTKTTCPRAAVVVNTNGVACTASAATLANNWTVTTCGLTTKISTPIAPGTCVASAPTLANNFTTTTCPTPVPATTPIQNTCVPSDPTALNLYTTTTCPSPTVGINVGIQNACVASAGTSTNLWVTTTCPGALSTLDPIAAGSCVLQTASALNSWVDKTCPVTTISSTPVDATSCTPVAASLGNNWTVTTCVAGPLTTSNIPIGTCVPSGPSAPNWLTTTCPPVTPVVSGIAAPCVASGATSANGYTATTCPAAAITTDVPVSSCTVVPAAAGNNYVDTTCRRPVVTTNVPAGGCTASGPTLANGWITTTCPSNNTTDVAVASCLPTDPTVANGYTTTTCVPHSALNVAAAPTCANQTPSAANNWVSIACHDPVPPLTPLTVIPSACTAVAASAANSYTATSCAPIYGQKIQSVTTTAEFTQTLSGTKVITTSPTNTTTTAPTDVDGTCYTSGVLPPLPTSPPTLPTYCLAWPCYVDTPNAVGGSLNSLADVAQYYYMTDLRPEMLDGTTTLRGIYDNAPWQHMSTYGLGLGVSGTLTFKPDYLTSSSGDFSLIRPPPVLPPATPLVSSLNWPAWPDLAINYASDARLYNDPKSIDDFWHAAVNGRGQYFSAGDPAAVVDALGAALTKIDSISGSGSGAAVSNGTPITNDNYTFLASFKTNEWSGDVFAQRIDLGSGNISSTSDWSAQTILDSVTSAACDNRKIYIRRAGATHDLANFSWNTRTCISGLPAPGLPDTGLTATEQALFGASAIAGLNQYAAMTDGANGTVDQRTAAAGSNLVNFIRGQRGLEVTTDAFIPNNLNTLYRKRAHVLGDIVGSVVAFVKEPSAAYADADYNAFKTAYAWRTPMIYVGANDGMLHAIYAPTSSSDTNFSKAGSEAWAYIPQVVMPDLYRLADTEYKVNHHFFVDGSPIYGDIYDAVGAAWKSILVGGLNAGGKGYYALDVTDPENPKSLWEFNLSSVCYDQGSAGTYGGDCNMGLSFGRPIITKLMDGTWVVLVTSGYNNVRASAGDGGGYLYVLNAVTGKIINKIATNVGSATNPSGLREINNYVANGALDNTTLRVYGGDLFGNIWRFDVNDVIAPAGTEATLVAVTKDGSGNTQPITTRVQLAEVDGQTMVVVGTGRFLGASDASNVQGQSIYGFKDTLSSSLVYSDLRSSLKVLGLTATGTIRTSACTVVASCGSTEGWILDMPESGERINIDPFIVAGTVVYVTNVPSNSACQAGGHSWLNYSSLLTGGAVPASATGESSVYLNDALSVGVSYVVLPSGQVIATSVGSDTSTTEKILPVEPPSPIGRRVSWREIRR